MKQNQFITEQLGQQIIKQSDRLYRIVYSYVKNKEDAMVIIQDAACKLLKKISSIEKPEHIKTWLFRVTNNTALIFYAATNACK